MENGKKVIKVSDVLNFLEEGKTRKDIQDHYGISQKELRELFQHPKLKGRKTKKAFEPSFVIEDDLDGDNNNEANEIAQTNSPQEQVETEVTNAAEEESPFQEETVGEEEEEERSPAFTNG